MIGSGLLTIPYTMSKFGFIFGTFLFLLAGVIIQFGSVLLLKAKNLSRHSNYSTIFYEIWPHKLAKGIGSIIVFITCLGVCMAELMILKNSIRKIFEDILD